MPITLTITENSLDEIKAVARQFVAVETVSPVYVTDSVGAARGATAADALRAAEERDAYFEGVKEAKAKVARTPRAKKVEEPAPAPVVEEAVVAQDAEDEAAETEDAAATATADTVREYLYKYAEAYGMEYAQEDGPKIFEAAFGVGVNKVKLIPEDAESYAKAVKAIETAISSNTFKRPVKDV